MSEMDMSVYLGVFLDEVDEQLQILDEEILNLEQDGHDMETIQRVFRAAHTLKGSSAAMGFEKMKELTHKVENVFDAIRNNQLRVDTNLINIIFQAIDFIKSLKEAIVEGQLDQIDVTPIVNELEKIKDGVTDIETNEQIINKDEPASSLSKDFPEIDFDMYQQSIIKQALADGYNVLAAYVGISPQSLLKTVRAFLIHNNLKEVGEVIASFPSTEVIENEEMFNGNLVYIIVTKETKQAVIGIINSISDISSVNLQEITQNVLEGIEDQEEKIEIEKPVQPNLPQAVKSDTKVNITQTVRVDVERLEHLMNLVGELVIDQTRLSEMKNKLMNRYPSDEDLEDFNEVGNHLGQVITELQEGMMKTRMLPIEQLFNRFPRMVRDLTQKANKEIDLIIQGKETELDRRLIEEIGDPIIHLLRNSIDHGVEPPDERERLGKPRKGQVLLKASHEENHIVITIADDGRGIDSAKIKASAIKKGLITDADAEHITDKEALFLIFKSGVSTAQKVTDISGRGVGMDIVRSSIEKLNGIIDIDSVIGEGTTFTLKLPLTLAIIRSLLINLGTSEFAIPLANVLEIIRLNKTEVKTIKGEEVGIVRDRVLPLVRMHAPLGIKESSNTNQKRMFVVVVAVADKRVGLIVDKTLGNQDIVIKPLGKYMGTPPYIAGATIMGDGDVALILDIGSIVREAGSRDNTYKHERKQDLIETENIIQLVTFKLGDEEYGLEIQNVKDIITVSEITEIMGAPYSVLGMINLRGKLIPVVDTRIRFHLVEAPLTRKSRIIVVEFEGKQIGLLVDQVKEVMKVNEKKVENPPDNVNQIEAKFLKGLCNLENERIIILLELHPILQLQELKELTESKQ